MFISKNCYRPLRSAIRSYGSQSNNTTSIMRTEYSVDSWTNIKPRFLNFVGTNLYKRQNPIKKTKHPLTAAHLEIITHLDQWFKENIDNINPLKVYKNLDPVEPNTSPINQQNTFYVNENFKLRTSLLDREMRYLKDGFKNFAIVTDLYRRCQMDATHFPVFHRLNVVRTMEMTSMGSDFDADKHFEHEQKTLLETIVKQLFENDVKFRWIEMSSTPLKPYWVLEIWHNDQWLKVSGAGIIQKDIFQHNNIHDTVGWEIGIGLDRLVMAVFKIFDIRHLWTSDDVYLNQFVPKSLAKIDGDQTNNEKNTKRKNKKPQVVLTEPRAMKPKMSVVELQVTYFLPHNVDLEEIPLDKLCETMKKNGENQIQDVRHFFSDSLNFF